MHYLVTLAKLLQVQSCMSPSPPTAFKYISLIPSPIRLKIPNSSILSLSLSLKIHQYIHLFPKRCRLHQNNTEKMEPNLPVAAKKIWSIVRVLFFMLRKGISKSKFMVDLNMMMKRGKLAGKALHNLMFHHHHSWLTTTHRRSHNRHMSFNAPPGEYEFSCSNSPAYPISLFPFHLNKNRKHHANNISQSQFFSCTQSPAADDDVMTVNAVMKALEMLQSETASPALPGFGRSPMVRQLRITDSPYPLRDVEEDSHVDEAAEEFIMKFYKELRKQI